MRPAASGAQQRNALLHHNRSPPPPDIAASMFRVHSIRLADQRGEQPAFCARRQWVTGRPLFDISAPRLCAGYRLRFFGAAAHSAREA